MPVDPYHIPDNDDSDSLDGEIAQAIAHSQSILNSGRGGGRPPRRQIRASPARSNNNNNRRRLGGRPNRDSSDNNQAIPAMDA